MTTEGDTKIAAIEPAQHPAAKEGREDTRSSTELRES